MYITTLYSVDKESCGSIYSTTNTFLGYFQSKLNAEVCAEKNEEYGRPAKITLEDFLVVDGNYYKLTRNKLNKQYIKDL